MTNKQLKRFDKWFNNQTTVSITLYDTAKYVYEECLKHNKVQTKKETKKRKIKDICFHCEGSGIIGFGSMMEQQCPKCKGKGKTIRKIYE